MQTASMSLASTTFRQSPSTRPMPNSPATRSPDSLLRLATDTSSTPGCALSFGMWWSLVFLPAPTKPTRIGRSVMMGSSLAVVETRDDELRLEGWPRHEGDEGPRRLRRGRPRRHGGRRSEEHTSELQSQSNLVCRLLLEKKKNKRHFHLPSIKKRS